ncbi:MAG: 3D domain-containing protein [Armatimonadota bacterium]
MRKRINRLARIVVTAALAIPMLTMMAANRDDVVQAQRLEAVKVKVKIAGTKKHITTTQTTVGAALKEAGIVVEPLDEVTPATNEQLVNGMEIRVVQIREVIETRKELIAFEREKQFTHDLRPGIVKVVKPGQRGEKIVKFVVRYEDGKPVERKSVGAEVVKKPVNEVVQIGSAGRYVSRGTFQSRKVLIMNASAYDPGPRSCGRYASGRTANGMKAGYGIAAVDPKVIPLGTKLYIEGYGHAVAADTGSAIKGHKIDLCYDTYAEAVRFGRKTVTVHILK